jgi:small-conductance mechanosensitive channel
MRRLLALVLTGLAAFVLGGAANAQGPGASAPSDPFAALAPTLGLAAESAQVADQPATLEFTNRPIVLLRAEVMRRPPTVRVAGAVELLDRLVELDPQGRVVTRTFDAGVVIGIGSQPVFVLFEADIDPLAGESLAGKSADAAARLDQAFREAVELRTPGRLLSGVAFAFGATVLFLLALWGLIRLDRRLAEAASRATERRLSQMSAGEVMMQVRAPMIVRRVLGLLGVFFGLLLTYSWLTAVLRRFPYTRPWGESLRETLIAAVESAARGVLDHLPNFVTVVAIVLITRFLIRLVTLAFGLVEQGRMVLPGLHPETVQPTRRIVVVLLWLFALVVSYKYLPGSDSEVFKGVSVFVGLVVSLGSSGIMNQVMSGLMVTYSRAVRLGDFVRIGEVEGTVTYLGTLSTKVRTPRNEEITIPNAVMVAQATTNFSRHAEHDGVFAPTSVTIGYDVPWRQIQALLLLAAERTRGVRQTPGPVVLQTALCDFYVQYTMLVCLDNPAKRLPTLNELHANIQDAFNEYGVQIMSPNYEADPNDRKVVPPSRWYSAPAFPPTNEAPDRPVRKTEEEVVGGA